MGINITGMAVQKLKNKRNQLKKLKSQFHEKLLNSYHLTVTEKGEALSLKKFQISMNKLYFSGYLTNYQTPHIRLTVYFLLSD